MPIIANGNVITWDDVVENQKLTGADGVMSAEGLLNDPTLFAPSIDGTYANKDKLDIAVEYMDIVDKYPVAIKSVIFHVRRMCSEYLDKFQLMVDLTESTTPTAVREVIESAIAIRDACARDGTEFVPDPKVGFMIF